MVPIQTLGSNTILIDISWIAASVCVHCFVVFDNLVFQRILWSPFHFLGTQDLKWELEHYPSLESTTKDVVQPVRDSDGALLHLHPHLLHHHGTLVPVLFGVLFAEPDYKRHHWVACLTFTVFWTETNL